SVDQALDYYRTTLGLELIEDGPRPDGSVRLAYLRAGDTTLQLVQPLIDGPAARRLATDGEGLHHICFEVDDLQRALDGIPGEAERVIEDGGMGCRVSFLGNGPDGVLIELSEGPR